MSDNENTETAAADDTKWLATLVGGTTYTFGGTKYEKGVEKPIDAATKKKLEDRAVDFKVVNDEYDEDGTAISEPRQKFTFKKVGEQAVSPAPRRRASR